MTAARIVGRAGGIAAALGAGALISLSNPATGSAAPPDSTTRTDSSQAAHTPRPPASRPVGRHQVTRPTAPRAPTAAVAPPRPAPAAVVVAPAAPDGRQSAPSAKSASLFDQRGRRLTILKGTHLAIPTVSRLWLTQTSGDATFTSDSAYDLKDEDQYDWNKLAGITFTPWRPERNAAMVVWRYNLTSQTYDVGPFFDNDFAYVFPSDAEVISVPADQKVRWKVDYTGITVSYGETTVFKPYPEGLTPKLWSSAKVTGWFGGSEAAPRTLSYYVHMR